MGGEFVFRQHQRPGCISKLASTRRVIDALANVTRGRAVRDIAYACVVENCVELTLLLYSIAGNPPGILEEDDAVPLDVICD